MAHGEFNIAAGKFGYRRPSPAEIKWLEQRQAPNFPSWTSAIIGSAGLGFLLATLFGA